MSDYVAQTVTPRRLRKVLEDNDINQVSFCELSKGIPSGGINPGSLSLFLSEQRPALSSKAQLTVLRLLDFFAEQRARANGITPNFNVLPEMKKRLREFVRERSQHEVVKTEAEEVAEATNAEKL